MSVFFTASANSDCHLNVVVKNEEATRPVKNIEVRIAQVAYLEDSMFYLTDDFLSSGIAISELSHANNASNAKAIYNFIKENDVSIIKAHSDATGNTTYSNLNRGIYVV